MSSAISIQGHEVILKRLKAALKNGTLSQALLFAGPRGVGKRETALWLAQNINCREAAGVACGTCAVCRRIREGDYPDVTQVQPDEKGRVIRIERVRQMKELSSLKPMEGRSGVWIINEAHTLNEVSQNALLKLLEEPPAEWYFVLITDRPEALLPTVLSRLLTVRFEPLPKETVARIAREQGLWDASGEIYAAWSEGSLERLRELKEGNAASLRTQVIENLDRIASRQILTSHEWQLGRDESVQMVNILATVVRDLRVIQANIPSVSLMHEDCRSKLESLVKKDSPLKLEEAFADCENALSAFEHNVYPWLVLMRLWRRLGGVFFK